MKVSLIFLVSIFLALLAISEQLEFDEIFDVNDRENHACQGGCEPQKVRMSTVKETYNELFRCSACNHLFELCVKYRTCTANCAPVMPVLPYQQAKDFAMRVRPPMNPCLELISACNYESPDAYDVLRTANPFLFI